MQQHFQDVNVFLNSIHRWNVSRRELEQTNVNQARHEDHLLLFEKHKIDSMQMSNYSNELLEISKRHVVYRVPCMLYVPVTESTPWTQVIIILVSNEVVKFVLMVKQLGMAQNWCLHVVNQPVTIEQRAKREITCCRCQTCPNLQSIPKRRKRRSTIAPKYPKKM